MIFRLWKASVAYGREYTRFSRNARLFLLSFFFGGMWYSTFILFFNFYLTSLHFEEGTIGLLNAVPAVSAVLFAIPIGYLGDRYGARILLIAGALLSTIGFAGLCFSEDLGLIVLCLFGSTIGQVIAFTLAAPFMAANSRPEERTQLFSLEFALGTMTHFLGNVAGGFLPGLYGSWINVPAASTTALRLTLLTGGFFLAISVLPLFWISRPPARIRPASGPDRVKRRVLPRNPALILWLTLPATMVGLGAGMTLPFLNLYISSKFQVDFAALGLLFGFAELGTTLAVFIQPVLARRFGKVRSVVLFQGLSLPLLIMLGYAPYFWLVALALYIRGALMNAANPVYQVFIQEQVPEDERATSSAVLSVTDSLSRGTGSAFSGLVRSAVGTATGFNILFALMITCYISSIGIFYFKFRHKDAEEAARNAQSPSPDQSELQATPR